MSASGSEARVSTTNCQGPRAKALPTPDSQVNVQTKSRSAEHRWPLEVGSALALGPWQLGVVFLAALLLTAATLSAQRPVFRSSRELVSIDVVVRDKNGEVVRGLTAADFELKEDG